METELTKILKENKETEYADFLAKLTPTINRDRFIGVRAPIIKQIVKNSTIEQKEEFICNLPHEFYDENMLHSSILSKIKNYEKCIEEVEKFLPFIDNWAVCDTLKPVIFAKNKDNLLVKIKKWTSSNWTFTIRFGVEILMNFYLDKDFKDEFLLIPLNINSNDYYVKMMIAWFFATALAKQWKSTITIIEAKRLPKWIHNKTIQKSIESYRISNEQKDYLRTLRIYG